MPKSPDMPGFSENQDDSSSLRAEIAKGFLKDRKPGTQFSLSEFDAGMSGAANFAIQFAEKQAYLEEDKRTPIEKRNSRDEYGALQSFIAGKTFGSGRDLVGNDEISGALQDLLQSKEAFERALKDFGHFEVLSSVAEEMVKKSHDLEGLERALETALEVFRSEKENRLMTNSANSGDFYDGLHRCASSKDVKDYFENAKDGYLLNAE